MGVDYYVHTNSPREQVLSLLEGEFESEPNGVLYAMIGDQSVRIRIGRPYRESAEDQFDTTLPLTAMFRVRKDDANATLDFVLAFARRLLAETDADVVWEADYGMCFLARIRGRLLVHDDAPWLWTPEVRATLPPHEVASLSTP